MTSIENIKSIFKRCSKIPEEQFQSILDSKNKEGIRLSDILSNKKFEDPEGVIHCMSQHLNIPYEPDIKIKDIPEHLIQNFPIQYAKACHLLPYKEEVDRILMLTSNPLDFQSFADLRLKFKKDIHPIMSTSQNIEAAINTIYEKYTGSLDDLGDIESEEYDLDNEVIDLLDAEDDAPVIKLVNTLLLRALKSRASDIHIEPYEKEMVIRFRVDGVLYSIFKPPKKLQGVLTSRVKLMANMNIAEKRLPQDGRIPLKLAGKDIDVRVGSVPTAFGERLVLRLQDKSRVILNLDQLGFSKKNQIDISHIISKTYGILLVTGPTGSGKSTTLYACISQMDTKVQNIITIEDPVEQRIENIGQIQVSPKIGLSFANGLRSILRQDPNVIMVGEIRDLETMKIAINASLTGHLVLSTLHTNDAAGVFPRLIDMGCEPFLIATSLLGILSQRLVRILCVHCKDKYIPSADELSLIPALTLEVGQHIYRAKGCSECEHKGYLGRSAIGELLLVNDAIRNLIIKNSDGPTIKKLAVAQGMETFRDHGIQKIRNGETTIEEVLANSQLDL